MRHIYPDYSYKIQECTTSINFIDGSGMMLPEAANVDGQKCGNFMVRLPYIKGLLTSFDYIKFCEQNDCEPVIEDFWHVKHNLIQERINIIFTQSQFKLAKYFDSWEDYKTRFKANHCTANRMNFEDEWIPDTQINYQMIQTLDMTDQEVKKFTQRAHTKLENIAKDKQSMLRLLGADRGARFPYEKSLCLYNELLRDGYSRQSIKAIKKRMLYDAKSGAIKCRNKRLFAIPDMYAACQYWFKHIQQPQGLLYGDEVYAKLFVGKGIKVSKEQIIKANLDPGLNQDEIIQVADVLRSPHRWCITLVTA